MEKCDYYNCKRNPCWIVEPVDADGQALFGAYYACGRHLEAVVDWACMRYHVTSVNLRHYIVITKQNVLAEKPEAELAERMTRVEKRAELLKSSYDLNSDFLVRLTQRVIALEEQNERGAFRAGRLP